MKYAIVERGGKQYKAVEGEMIDIDLMQIEIGEKFDIDSVLLISNGGKVSVGTPTLKGAKVKVTVVDQIKAKKVIVFKYRPRQRYRVKKGHRQRYTRLMVDKIVAKSAAKKKETTSEESSKED